MFHAGELFFQKKAGLVKSVAGIAAAMVHNQLTAQQWQFYSQLSMLFVASLDHEGHPWASVITGSPGFIHSLTANQLRLNAKFITGDPINSNLKIGGQLGFLGVEFNTRRRNRMSGIITASNTKNVIVDIKKGFGNCPKYIQTRNIKMFAVKQRSTQLASKMISRVEFLTTEMKQLISSANTFFIASSYSDNGHDLHFGADVSHRGGRPGFVRVESNNNLSFDDYSGNNFFMTLGNLHSNPVAGLLFIDFKTGDTLQLACSTKIVESTKKLRQVKLTLKYAWFIQSALSIDSEFLEYSPFLNTRCRLKTLPA
ncbi:probable iron-sulfur binding protein YPO1417 [hydrothermal vent metagenome]|uniref:Probable iron-sulfur binding protein YPO1417 n=1 Tax=hydrothermal vent metagenome TaxID=652676 RepID=A0A3B1ACX7_9ZZZZ